MAPTAPIIHATAFAVACEAAPAAFTVVVAAACAAEIVESATETVEGDAELIAEEPELEDEPENSTWSATHARLINEKGQGKEKERHFTYGRAIGIHILRIRHQLRLHARAIHAIRRVLRRGERRRRENDVGALIYAHQKQRSTSAFFYFPNFRSHGTNNAAECVRGKLTLYNPPSGSPFVTTCTVAFIPSTTLTPPTTAGTTTPPKQKFCGPFSRVVGTSTVLNALPGSLPSARRTWMLVCVCSR